MDQANTIACIQSDCNIAVRNSVFVTVPFFGTGLLDIYKVAHLAIIVELKAHSHFNISLDPLP